MPADSAKIEDIERLVEKVKETTDHVDILFANAGATWGEKFDTHPDGAFAKVMDLNVKSVFNTIRLYVPTFMYLARSLAFFHTLLHFPMLFPRRYRRDIDSHHFFRRMQR